LTRSNLQFEFFDLKRQFRQIHSETSL
jgi:hypothetical protein